MYKILKKFTDKVTKEEYIVGDKKEFTKARAKQILAHGKYIELIDEPEYTPEETNAGESKELVISTKENTEETNAGESK